MNVLENKRFVSQIEGLDASIKKMHMLVSTGQPERSMKCFDEIRNLIRLQNTKDGDFEKKILYTNYAIKGLNKALGLLESTKYEAATKSCSATIDFCKSFIK